MGTLSEKVKECLANSCDQLNELDIKNIKYLCQDSPAKGLDNVKTGEDLMQFFQSNFAFKDINEAREIEELFNLIDKKDLENEIKKIITTHQPQQRPMVLLAPGDFDARSDFTATKKKPSETADHQEPDELQNNVVSNEDQNSRKTKGAGRYQMEVDPRGLCVIINNTFKITDEDPEIKSPDGEVLGERRGTEYDRARLKALFEWLKFKVEVKDDLTAEQIKDVFKNLQCNVSEQSDCFVCCILTHGYKFGLYGNDGKKIEINKLRDYVDANRVPKLAGKPKLFFIQACRGKKDGAVVQRDSPFIPRSPTESLDGSVLSELEFENEPAELEPRLASLADIFIADATSKGFASYRDPKEGSFYIQALCEVFEGNADEVSLNEMMLMVNEKLAKKKADLPENVKASQISDSGCITLVRHVFFNPGVTFEEFARMNVRGPSEN